MSTRFFIRTMVAVALLGSSSALAGLLVRPEAIPEKVRAQLQARIAEARQKSPAAFQMVARTREKVADLDARKRGRIAAVSPMLKAIGPEALWPMLDQLAFDATPRGGLTNSAYLALRIGLIEAVGMLNDIRAVPVLSAGLARNDLEPEVLRATAEALGRIGDDASVQKLVELASASGPKQKPVLSALGECRRLAAAQALARALEQDPSPELARVVAKSLGRIGSAWAWQTPGLRSPAEQGPVRQLAARTLMTAFVRYDGEVRQAASNALMAVDEPSTPSLIASAKVGATGELVAALGELEARFARNPTRSR